MNNRDDLRLIEDYLPIEAISVEATREKSVRKGHISTLHLWWARRPLVACRAAVYGALVPASRFVPNGASDVKKKSLGRANAAKFVTQLCRYPSDAPKESDKKRETTKAIADARTHILEAHADRLTAELVDAQASGKVPAWVDELHFKGDKVSLDDIIAGRAPRPLVLDMFAGGGAIPLEALRLGCAAYSLDLNPVAHIVQLCTLVFPQKYGKPNPSVRGTVGPTNRRKEPTWGGLSAEFRYWGEWVIERVRKEIGDLYPLIRDPTHTTIVGDQDATKTRGRKQSKLPAFVEDDDTDDEPQSTDIPEGYLTPISFMWTRTVTCPNPSCRAHVPMARQTWLVRKKDRYIAASMCPDRKSRRVKFEVVTATDEAGFGFDPGELNSRGSTTCPFCASAVENTYAQREGIAGRLGVQLVAVGVIGPTGRRRYLSPDCIDSRVVEAAVTKTLSSLNAAGMSIPDEDVPSDRRESFWCRSYGLTRFSQVFLPRQLAALLTFCRVVREAHIAARNTGLTEEYAKCITTYLGLMVDRVANQNNGLCIYSVTRETVEGLLASKKMPMTWDFVEANPLGPTTGNAAGAINWITEVVNRLSEVTEPATVIRGSAAAMESVTHLVDAVITDPPYYDNISYSDLSDFFYVWLKRSIGHLYPEHFSAQQSPKKNEAIAHKGRANGDMKVAKAHYESLMAESFIRANEVMKPHAPMIVVYAHKTTLGWATLVDALRRAAFTINEAWPLDTELASGMVKQGMAMLASSIFLVARKRDIDAVVGSFEDHVQPELQQIVKERVATLWEMGIGGADLVIACVGAGLRAFTKYKKVEYANGEEVPAEKFLAEVESVVLDAMLGKILGKSSTSVSSIDPSSRFYVLWRFVYKAAEIEAGEAIIFTYAQHVELDGQLGLSTGKDALVEKNKAKYRARDFTERGDYDKLGMSSDDGRPVPLIDVLHRVLWLMENRPRKLAEFLNEAGPDRERLRVLAQALSGAALSGKTEVDVEKLVGTTAVEKVALGKLLANWRSVIDNAIESRAERAERERGQQKLFK